MQTTGFLIPCDYFKYTRSDPAFEDIFKAIADAGYPITLIDSETLKPTTHVCADNYWYKGWMLNATQYKKLADTVPLIISPDEYVASHHINGWYAAVKDYTFESVFTDDPVQSFIQSGWDKAIIKDFVKSLNTGTGSVVCDKESIPQIISSLEKYRGQIEGGIVLRKFEDLKPDSETRFFVYNGVVHSPTDNHPVLDFADTVQKLHLQRFFSLDIVETSDGDYRVVEIGDGQVSDLKRWSVEKWVSVFLDSEKQKLKPR